MFFPLKSIYMAISFRCGEGVMGRYCLEFFTFPEPEVGRRILNFEKNCRKMEGGGILIGLRFC